MKRIVTWIVDEHENMPEQTFNRQMDAKKYEAALKLFDLVEAFIHEADVEMKEDVIDFMRLLFVDGLTAWDVSGTAPQLTFVFLDRLAEAMDAWTVTGRNPFIEKNRAEADESQVEQMDDR